MKIGDLAKWAQCPAVTIRYYEKMGLLSGDKRDRLNHRIYDTDDCERLRFIMHCRNHRIPLADIKLLLELRNGAKDISASVSGLMRKHLQRLKAQRNSLDQLINSLNELITLTGEEDSGDSEILAIFGSPCPHCPDYGDMIKKGAAVDSRAACLASPCARKDNWEG